MINTCGRIDRRRRAALKQPVTRSQREEEEEREERELVLFNVLEPVASHACIFVCVKDLACKCAPI